MDELGPDVVARKFRLGAPDGVDRLINRGIS
jgi:hypothetical protein